MAGAILEISLSSFQTACCRGLLQCTYTVESLRRVSSDAATLIFAKVSNFVCGNQKKDLY